MNEEPEEPEPITFIVIKLALLLFAGWLALQFVTG